MQLASQFLASMAVREWACTPSLWVHVNAGAGTQGAVGLGRWDEGVLEIVGGSQEEGQGIQTWLGDVEVADTVITPFTSDYLSSYLSLCPSPGDAVLSFGPMDTLLTPLNVTSTLQPIPPSCPGSQ
ncbi:hypothetical protein BD769DRAFT_1439220 [Suillus cothurnatus]|nr:hypothetical protein BD769DRAFT_1490912 [Suillus cothurnatus]KAG2136915.1 hypothetical protein BD769DRAFT_1439220 [Suillus cothurnatus]